jgi:predicted transposase/invertase (TIGR01784 family)
LIRRYHELDSEEIRRMFKLHDIHKTRVWQEAYEEGRKLGIQRAKEQGIKEGRLLEKQRIVKLLQADGKTLKEIAQLTKITLAEIRRLSKG